MDIRKVLGNNLKALRGETSQSVVAEACGFEIGSLSRWENAKAWASDDTVTKLAEYYGVSPSELYIERGFKGKLVALDSIKQSEFLKIFVSKVQKVPDDIYELAEKYGADHEVWKDVRKAFEIYEMGEERKRAKEKSKQA